MQCVCLKKNRQKKIYKNYKLSCFFYNERKHDICALLNAYCDTLKCFVCVVLFYHYIICVNMLRGVLMFTNISTYKYKLVNPILYVKLFLCTHYAHICAYALLIIEGPGLYKRQPPDKHKLFSISRFPFRLFAQFIAEIIKWAQSVLWNKKQIYQLWTWTRLKVELAEKRPCSANWTDFER